MSAKLYPGMIWMDKKSQARRLLGDNVNDLVLTTTSKDREPETVECYLESENGSIGFPRFWIRDFQPKLYNRVLIEGRAVPAKKRFTFRSSLWPEQVEPASVLVERLRKVHGGVLQAKGGRGKTVVALYAVAGLQQRTLIAVDKEFLLEQWIERIEQFLGIPREKIGRIQGDTCEVRDITVALIQSLYSRNYGPAVTEGFGLFVVDEFHEYGKKRIRALAKIGAPYRLGLSATPVRKDGLTRVLRWFFGGTLALISADTVPVTVAQVSTGVKFGWVKRNTKLEIVQSISNKNAKRNVLINEKVEWTKKNRHKTLVLSTSSKQLLALSNLNKSEDKGFLIGKHPISNKITTEAERKAACQKTTVYATLQLVNKALDVPGIDTVIFATPIGDPRQASYRAARKFEGKTNALLIDFVDVGIPHHSLKEARERRYEEDNYQVMTWEEYLEMKRIVKKKAAVKEEPKKAKKTDAVPDKKTKAVTPPPAKKKAKVEEPPPKKRGRPKKVEEVEEEEEEEEEIEEEEVEEDEDSEEEEEEEGEEEEEESEEEEEEGEEEEEEEEAEEEEGEEEEEEESEEEEEEGEEEEEESEEEEEEEEEEEGEDDEDEGEDGEEESEGEDEADSDDSPPPAKRGRGRPRGSAGAGTPAKGVKASANGAILVQRTWFTPGEDPEEFSQLDVQVKRFTVPPEELAHVKQEISHTISLPNNQFVKINVGIDLPCYAASADILHTQEAAEKITRARLEHQVTNIKAKLRNKDGDEKPAAKKKAK